jgi:phosphatidylinositol alpha-1,6-mannosyltransferase
MLRLPENASRVWWLLTLARRIRRILTADNSITHVYFHDGLAGLCCRSIKKYSNVTTIVTFHGLDVVYPNGIYQKRIADNLKNNIDIVIPVSAATGAECIKRGAAPEKVHPVLNGVDRALDAVKTDKTFLPRLEERLGIPLANKKILVSTGRSVKRKGFSWFMNNVLPALDDNIIYVMAGPVETGLGWKLFLMNLLPQKISRQIWLTGIGIDYAEIGKAMNTGGLKGRAFHLGKLPFADLLQLLKSSYAFIMPNIHIEGDAEGFGLVALEAAMCGTAVLASGIEGITDAIHNGKNGILVEGGNARAWEKAARAICSSPAKRKRIADSAAAYTKSHFSWGKMARGYLKVFTES